MIRVDEILPFPGYRELDPLGHFGRAKPVLYSTLEHFYQAERFRGSCEETRRRVLDAPTAHEAHKIGNACAEHSRPDWISRHIKAMTAGLWMQLREHPKRSEYLKTLSEGSHCAYPFRDTYWDSQRPGVSSSGFHHLLLDARDRLQGPFVRVAITGSKSFQNYFLLQTKCGSLFKNLPGPDVILIGGNKGTDELAERWAMDQMLPVKHFPMRGRGSRTERDRHNQALIRSATHVVIFSQGDEMSSRLFELAKTLGRPARVVQVDASGALQRSAN